MTVYVLVLYFLVGAPMVDGVYSDFKTCEATAHHVVNTNINVDTASCFRQVVNAKRL
jgi:hypothetical protein